MEAEDLAQAALEGASELLGRMSRELQDRSGGDTGVLYDAVRIVSEKRRVRRVKGPQIGG